MKAESTGSKGDSAKALLPLLAARLAVFYLVIGALVFGAAGTLRYPGGWFLMGYFLLFSTTIMACFLKRDPDFIRRRLDLRERQKPQKRIILLSLPVFLALFVLPALDQRFGWTRGDWLWIGLGALLSAGGSVLVIGVFLQNRWASRTIEVNEGQKLIDRGFYAFVRHPMYLGVLFLYPGLSLLLASPWGLVTLPFLLAVLVARIRNEEEFLCRELPGYTDYRERTRWRLLPPLW
jgi:protein-S-isoprenylcysteine O-methyltransferase Ste14